MPRQGDDEFGAGVGRAEDGVTLVGLREESDDPEPQPDGLGIGVGAIVPLKEQGTVGDGEPSTSRLLPTLV